MWEISTSALEEPKDGVLSLCRLCHVHIAACLKMS